MKSSAKILSLSVLSFAGLATAHDEEPFLLGRQANNDCPTCDPTANQCGTQASCDIRGNLLENACVCSYGRRASLDRSWRLYVEEAEEYIVIVPQGVACDQQCTVLQFDNVCGEVPDVSTTCTTSETSTSPSPESTAITTDDNSTTGDLTSTTSIFTTDDTSTSEDLGSQTSSEAVFTDKTSSDITTALTTTTIEDPMSSTTMTEDSTTENLTWTTNGFTTETTTSEGPVPQTSSTAVFTEQTSSDITTALTTTTEDPSSSTTMMDDDSTTEGLVSSIITDDTTSSSEGQGSRTSSTVVFTETTSSDDTTTTEDLPTSTSLTPTAESGSTNKDQTSTTSGFMTDDATSSNEGQGSQASSTVVFTEKSSSDDAKTTATTQGLSNSTTTADNGSTTEVRASTTGGSTTDDSPSATNRARSHTSSTDISTTEKASSDSEALTAAMNTMATEDLVSTSELTRDASAREHSATHEMSTTAEDSATMSGEQTSSHNLMTSGDFQSTDALSMATKGSRSDVFESRATLDISTSTAFSGSLTSPPPSRTLPKTSASEILDLPLSSDGRISTPYTPVFTLVSESNRFHIAGTNPAPPDMDSAYPTYGGREATETSDGASENGQPVDHSRSVFVGSTSVTPLASSTPLPEEATNTVALVCCTCALGVSPLTLTRNADARWTTRESVTDQLITAVSGRPALGKGGKEHSSTDGFDDSMARKISWTSPNHQSLVIASGGNYVFSLSIFHLVLVVFCLGFILP